MDIDIGKREEWEAHIHTVGGDMFAVWIGHMRGSFYGNFSFRKDGKIIEKSRGFHLRREMFDFYLSLPLGWCKIIDCKLNYGENKAECGVDLKTGEFIDDVVSIEELSK